MSAVLAAAPAKVSLVTKIASRFSVEPAKLMTTLKATAFKVKDGEATDEQMMALLIVADQYGLNPFTKEIYAFPDKGGIVPVVSVDGWARIINEHPQFDGMEFHADAESCTCIIYRKDRSHPTSITEYMVECKRGTQPWGSHPRRMLRHKAMIQCARVAFGFAGIYDPDEAERIRDAGMAEDVGRGATIHQITEVVEAPAYPQDAFEKNLPTWRGLIAGGKKSADQIIATVQIKGTLTDEQIAAIKAPAEEVIEAVAETTAEVE